MKRFFSSLSAVFASRGFFIAVMVFFVIEALWIAFSAIYPMAFDEDFHLGIIQIYASHLSPFLTEHPANADAYGAITRDPSYLYHYLMSFPYRALTHIFDSQTQQIIALRIMNVAMFAYALMIFRRLLLRMTQSRAFTHVAIAIFILIPIVPQLAAHINYDNLLMIGVAWSCLLATDIHRQFTARHIDIRSIGALVAICLLTSVVKYAFLPIFFGIFVFLAYDAVRTGAWRLLWSGSRENIRHMAWVSRIGLLAVVLLGCVLFVQRFGINTVRYHNPIPDCDQVLSIDHCSAYGPWNRDHLLAQSKGEVNANPAAYTLSWIKGLWWRLFFAINSPTRNYTNYPPLPFPAITALALPASILVLMIIFWRRFLTGQPLLLFAGIVTVIYCGTLWIQDYDMFTETGQPVAINGRYLLPVLLLIAALGWRAWQLLAERWKAPLLKPVAATVVLLCFLQGGGVFTFIMRSDPSWYWPNQRIIQANTDAQRVLGPIIIEGSKETTIAP